MKILSASSSVIEQTEARTLLDRGVEKPADKSVQICPLTD